MGNRYRSLKKRRAKALRVRTFRGPFGGPPPFLPRRVERSAYAESVFSKIPTTESGTADRTPSSIPMPISSCVSSSFGNFSAPLFLRVIVPWIRKIGLPRDFGEEGISAFLKTYASRNRVDLLSGSDTIADVPHRGQNIPFFLSRCKIRKSYPCSSYLRSLLPNRLPQLSTWVRRSET